MKQNIFFNFVSTNTVHSVGEFINSSPSKLITYKFLLFYFKVQLNWIIITKDG